MRDVIEGRVWTLPGDVDTDQIISGKYLTVIDPNELKKHVFEIALPEVCRQRSPGGHRGRGRQHGLWFEPGTRAAGAEGDRRRRGDRRQFRPNLLPEFHQRRHPDRRSARAFVRSSRRATPPASRCERGRIQNLRTGASVQFPPLPAHLLELLEAGGLVEKVKREIQAGATVSPR